MKRNEQLVMDWRDYQFEHDIIGLFEGMDGETFNHSMSMGKIAARIAKAVSGTIPHKLSKSELDYVLSTGERRLSFVFAMHDLGKTDEDIQKVISKPGSLDSSDWQVIEKHPYCGAMIIHDYFTERGLDKSYPRDMIAAFGIALSHHMFDDGTGYPARAPTQKITGLTKIATLADNIDAISAKRVYKPAFSNDEVKEAIQEKAAKHKQFDDDITHIVVGMWRVIEDFLDNRGVAQTAWDLMMEDKKRQPPMHLVHGADDKGHKNYNFIPEVHGKQQQRLAG